MKNFEFFEKEIKSIFDLGGELAVINGKPMACSEAKCKDCLLKDNPSAFCSEKSMVNWLYQEHVEAPKINKKTKFLLEILETGWISRDADGDLYWSKEKPIKNFIGGFWDFEEEIFHSWEIDAVEEMFFTFNFIKWEDEEPRKVEDLLKLEVFE